MKYIVFDLEFTVLRSRQHLSEIIEIGAIELRAGDDCQLAMADLFHSYVRPYCNPNLSSQTSKLTGITQEQINQAPIFYDAVQAFQEWLGEGEYYLCSWGPDDKYQFVKQCRECSIDLNWIRNYNDIQQQFSQMHSGDSYRCFGLMKSLEMLNIPFFGQHHNALDDAFNTAKLFIKVFPQLTFEQNNAALENIYTTEIVYSTGQVEENRPFGQLAHLLEMTI